MCERILILEFPYPWASESIMPINQTYRLERKGEPINNNSSFKNLFL